MQTHRHDRAVIIIGSGPASLTAALYTARAVLAPLVLAGFPFGGQLMLTSEVENYPGYSEGVLGPAMMGEFRAQAEPFGAEVRDAEAMAVDLQHRPFTVRTDEASYPAVSMIIATGASARWLRVPGEERLLGRSVSACATCDGFFFRDQHGAAIGGDSALEEALFLSASPAA